MWNFQTLDEPSCSDLRGNVRLWYTRFLNYITTKCIRTTRLDCKPTCSIRHSRKLVNEFNNCSANQSYPAMLKRSGVIHFMYIITMTDDNPMLQLRRGQLEK